MERFVRLHDGNVLARLESRSSVVEFTFDLVEATDVTLRLYRDDTQIGSIYNDDGTDRTMARIVTNRDGSSFVGIEVPKEFVREILDVAEENDMINSATKVEGYRMRVLDQFQDE